MHPTTNSNRNKSPWRLLALLGLAGLGFGVCAVALGVFMRSQSREEELASNSDSAVTIHLVGRIVSALDKDCCIAIVEFESDRVQPAFCPSCIEAEPANFKLEDKNGLVPATVLFQAPSDPEVFRCEIMKIQGKFTVVSDLHRRLPRWGHVSVEVKVSRSGSGKRFREVYSLLAARRTSGPVTMLVIESDTTTSPRDASYYGPLTSGDCRSLSEFFDLVHKEHPDAMSKDAASALLQSPNPWVAWLGLTRLKRLKELGPKHFVIASRSRAASNMPTVVGEIFQQTWGDTDSNALETLHFAQSLRKNGPDALLFKETTAEKQEEALKALVSYIKNNRPAVQEIYLDVNELGIAARRHRAQLLHNGERVEVVGQLESLLIELHRVVAKQD